MIKSIFRGAVIGVANIIPGVSGGTMMVSMGIYDKLIHCITHIRKEFKQSIRFLLPIAIGMALGILILSTVISFAFEKVPLQTNCLFIGLIVGSVPFIYKHVQDRKVRLSHIIAFVLFLVLVIGSSVLGGSEHETAISHSPLQFLTLCAVGIIASATMIIPGVSGSMVLMILGYYQPILNAVKDFISHALHLDLGGLANDLFVLIPFGIGVVLGIVVIAKLVDFIFKRYPLIAYWAILGLIAASPFAILIASEIKSVGGVVGIVTSIAAFAVGAFAGNRLGGDSEEDAA